MLVLGESSVSFEPSGSLSDIFFDNVNCKICTVRGNGAIGVTFKGLEDNSLLSVRIKDLGKIKTVKLSPNGRLASIQRNDSCVDFAILQSTENSTCHEFSQVIKVKNGVIRHVEWVSSNQVMFVTNSGLELYQVNEEKKTSKLMKSLNVASDWSTYYHPSRLFLLATGVNWSILQPFVVHQGQIHRLPKFQIDFGCSNFKSKLLERDVTVASVYGGLYVIALRFSNRDSSATHLSLYKLTADTNSTPQLKYTLDLGFPGMFGTHVIDNLVIVHHQMSTKSLIFDVGLAPEQTSHSAVAHCSMRAAERLVSVAGHSPTLYTPSWVVFAPNIVIDPPLGLFSALSVKPEEADIPDTLTRLRFLMNRRAQKATVLREINTSIKNRTLTLRNLQKVFSTIVGKSSVARIPVLKPSESRSLLSVDEIELLRIDQDEIQGVFMALREDPSTNKAYLASAMLSYLAVLHSQTIVVQPYFLELLVGALVDAGELRKLHQLLTYSVIQDSRQMAYLLVSLEAKYPPLLQSGVDMLVREGATDEIVEVLLSKGHAIEALRYIDSAHSTDRFNCLKTLDSVWENGDRVSKYAIYTECAERKAKGKQVWPEQFERFSKDFKKLYKEEEIVEADRDVALAVLHEEHGVDN